MTATLCPPAQEKSTPAPFAPTFIVKEDESVTPIAHRLMELVEQHRDPLGLIGDEMPISVVGIAWCVIARQLSKRRPSIAARWPSLTDGELVADIMRFRRHYRLLLRLVKRSSDRATDAALDRIGETVDVSAILNLPLTDVDSAAIPDLPRLPDMFNYLCPPAGSYVLRVVGNKAAPRFQSGDCLIVHVYPRAAYLAGITRMVASTEESESL